jgi:hypothetical protein
MIRRFLTNTILNAITTVICTVLAIYYIGEVVFGHSIIVAVVLYIACFLNMLSNMMISNSLINLRHAFDSLHRLAGTLHQMTCANQAELDALRTLVREKEEKKEKVNDLFISRRDDIKPS